MRSRTTIIAALVGALALGGCQREDEQGPLAVSGRLFIFNYRVADATYVLTLSRNGPLPDESYIETRYEDPRGGAPIVTRTRIFPFWEKISLESPPVHCIVKDRPYAVEMRVTDAKGKLIQALETTVTSSLDQTILPARPLVIGPIYTANPEVFAPGEKPDFSPETGCPAQ